MTTPQRDVPRWFQEEGIDLALGPVHEATYGRATYPSLAFHIHEQRAFPFTVPASAAPIVLIPVDVPWQVRGYLQLCGMDTWHAIDRIDGMEGTHGVHPQVHVALLTYWYEGLGAEVVAATAGDLELRVLRPPTTSAAVALAKEQYMFCRDLVDQHTGVSPSYLNCYSTVRYGGSGGIESG